MSLFSNKKTPQLVDLTATGGSDSGHTNRDVIDLTNEDIIDLTGREDSELGDNANDSNVVIDLRDQDNSELGHTASHHKGSSSNLDGRVDGQVEHRHTVIDTSAHSGILREMRSEEPLAKKMHLGGSSMEAPIEHSLVGKDPRKESAQIGLGRIATETPSTEPHQEHRLRPESSGNVSSKDSGLQPNLSPEIIIEKKSRSPQEESSNGGPVLALSAPVAKLNANSRASKNTC
ncbi:hypothetical protein PtA15_5A38 [Puccinia triticina]|uniref:Uncharacterized protein n=1 Tax=Puccinia triticina TaxID=208348 RepID=A0ABY7CHS8_9BASI|nr:uncharacterized protein PtA15_5A38 [Puccinia triticina]WAQ84468.1 hypothetical protein PtA15_5A38 [Puccinia triticina]